MILYSMSWITFKNFNSELEDCLCKLRVITHISGSLANSVLLMNEMEKNQFLSGNNILISSRTNQ